MDALIRNNVRSVTPYTAGERPADSSIIKLNTNENPYPPSPGVIEAFKNLSPESFRLYPDAESRTFAKSAARFYRINENQVLPANGSDDALALIYITFFNSGKPVLFPDVTYSFYPVWCGLYGIPYKTVPLDGGLKIDVNDYVCENGGIILANPNAPTGVALTPCEIRFILENNPGVFVVVDEAYIDFGGESVVPLLHEYENLLVVHTFSKYRSLAGMRIALAMGSEEASAHLNAVKNSYNSYPLSVAAQTIASAAIEDDAYYRANAERIMETKAYFLNELDCMGFNMLPSSANFVFTTHADFNAEDIFNHLKTKKIYVRYFNKPRINNYLRISIGTRSDMKAVADTIGEYIKRGRV